MKENRFIERPVLAICISIGIVFLGILALTSLSIEKFPDIAPPTVHVSATYMGASAETVQKAVIVPLEEAINGVEHMTYMESSASSGSASINIYFKQGTDPDQAAVNVQNKVSEAQGQLPSEVTKIGVTVEKRQISTLAMIGVYSPDDSFDETFITNYININIAPQIQRIEGVGEVRCMGGTYSMRIWLDPEAMAHYGLVPSDITAVLDEQNIEASTGSFGENSDNVFTYTMKYRGRYQTPEEFGQLVVRSTADGEILRLKDIAEIELGSQEYTYIGGLNGHPGVTMMINQTAGSNATDINMQIEALLEELSESFPAGLDYLYLQNTNDFLFASISEVIKTLFEAIILVVLVVFFFLHDYKLTLIPTLSLIVSLIGSFAVIYLLGFSLNLLTLFALILVIGTVVDDAIVVVEAVQAKMEEGEENAADATASAMHEITAAVVTSTIVFMAVFIPISFMSGTSGIFYRQFGLTMAVAVAISMVNALTLSPALSALLLQRKSPDRKFKTMVKKAYEVSYEALSHKYESGLRLIFRHKWVAGAGLVCAVICAVLLMKNTKTGLIPSEDTGTLFVSVNTAPGSNTQFTNGIIDNIETIIRTYPEIKAYSRVVGHSMTGGSGSSSGMLILQLKDWNDRKGDEHSSTAIMERLNRDMRNVKDAEVFVMAPSMIDGYGYEFGSSSREESSSDNTVYILIVCVVFIYLLLCSLYESFFVPFAVILSVPFGIFGCFAAANIFGVENNIYLQTGMIMIIGLLAKTAILITEYAAQRRHAGMSIEEAAFDAAKVRLRPIMMTVLTLVFGMLPLLYASGASANGNRTLAADLDRCLDILFTAGARRPTRGLRRNRAKLAR